MKMNSTSLVIFLSSVYSQKAKEQMCLPLQNGPGMKFWITDHQDYTNNQDYTQYGPIQSQESSYSEISMGD